MAGDVKVKITADTTGVSQGVSKIHSSISGLKGSVSSMGSAFKTALGPITAITTLLGGLGIGAGIKDILDFGGSISELSSSLGIGKDKLVIFQEAFKQSGIEADKLQGILAKLSANIDSPSDDMLIWFEKFGINLQDIQSMGVAERFELIGTKIGGMTSHTQRISAAMDIFGKKIGTMLIPLFRTKDAMADAQIQVGGLAGNMVKYADSFDYVGDIFSGIGTKIRQVFAGLAGTNIDRLMVLADKFKSMDLTSFGEDIGKSFTFINDIIVNLSDAFDKGGGAFADTIWRGLDYVWADSTAHLVAIFKYLGQVLVESIKTQLKSLGLPSEILNMIFPKDNTKANLIFDYNEAENRLAELQKSNDSVFGARGYTGKQEKVNAAIKEVELRIERLCDYAEPIVPTLNDIKQEEHKKAGVDALWNKYMSPKTEADKTRDAADMVKAIEDGFNLYFDGLDWLGDSSAIDDGFNLYFDGLDFMDSLQEPLEEILSNPYTPVNTSLGRVGGDSGSSYINSYTNNPLVSLQQRANAYLQKIADNTANISAPAWGS